MELGYIFVQVGYLSYTYRDLENRSGGSFQSWNAIPGSARSLSRLQDPILPHLSVGLMQPEPCVLMYAPGQAVFTPRPGVATLTLASERSLPILIPRSDLTTLRQPVFLGPKFWNSGEKRELSRCQLIEQGTPQQWYCGCDSLQKKSLLDTHSAFGGSFHR